MQVWFVFNKTNHITTMNFKKLLGVVLLSIPALVFAQKEIVITEAEKEMSAGTKNGFVTVIPQANGKEVTDEWKKYVRKDTKAKPEDVNGEVKIIGAVNKNISSFPINVFAKILETGEGVQLTVWVAEGEIFVSSKTSSDKSVAVQKYIHDFAAQEYRDAVKKEVDNEQKKAKDLEKIFDGFVADQKRSEGNIASYNKEIEKLQTKIKEEEANIQKAKDNQTAARANADKQKEVVNGVSTKMNNIK